MARSCQNERDWHSQPIRAGDFRPADTVRLDSGCGPRRCDVFTGRRAYGTTIDTEPTVQVHSGDAVGWITLNRPATINAINDAIRSGVPAVLDEMDRDDAIRVILIRGSGPRSFYACADINVNKPVEGPVAARYRLMKAP